MTYVVTENCIKCKYMDCVEVCPVDCFYVGREHAGHPSRTSASIAASASRNARPRPSCPDSDDRAGAWLEQNRTFADAVAQHHPQGRSAGGRRRVEGQARQGRVVLARAGRVT